MTTTTKAEKDTPKVGFMEKDPKVGFMEKVETVKNMTPEELQALTTLQQSRPLVDTSETETETETETTEELDYDKLKLEPEPQEHTKDIYVDVDKPVKRAPKKSSKKSPKEEGPVEDPPEAPSKPPTPKKEAKEKMPVIERETPAPQTQAVSAMREDEATDLRSMIEGMAADKGYEVRIYRTAPKKWANPDGNTVSIEGHLGTFEEWQSEEDLKAMYGGGTFQMKVFSPDTKGSLRYFKTASVKISGKPKHPDIQDDLPQAIDFGPPAHHEDNSLGAQAMSTMQALLDKKQEGNGMDPAMIELITGPLKAQIEANNQNMLALQQAMTEKDNRILELITHKPDTSEKDGLLNKMFDSEASRSEHLRATHESEMRQMRENAREDIKRAEDRHRDELRDRSESHRREIDSLQKSNDNMMATTKMAYESRMQSLQAEINRAQLDLTEARAELGALRLKKDKTLIEQASELQLVGESLKSLGIGGSKDDETDDRKWYEKLVSQVVENPEGVAQVVGMVSGGGSPTQQAAPNPPQQQMLEAPPQAPQAPHQAPPQTPQAPSSGPQEEQVFDIADIQVGQPFRNQDGDILVKLPDGSIVSHEHAVEIAQGLEAKSQEGKAQPPSETEVKMAISFMESAFTAGTDAAVFATGARSSIPGGILKYIESVGIDTFLNEVATLDQNSPLRNQAGRTFMRDVAKFLLEGVPG